MIRYLTSLVIFWLCIPFACADETLHIHLSGIAAAPAATIQDRLNKTMQDYGEHLNTHDIENIYLHAPAQIKTALEPFGYFKATIFNRRLTHQGHQWTADFFIAPGPALPITSLAVSIAGAGKNNEKLQTLLQHFPLHEGDTFLAEDYEKAKDTLLETANQAGYLHATFSHKEVQINLHNYTARIFLELQTGPRFYFGTITFNQTPFSRDFLQRFVTIKKGEPFSSETLLKFQQDLNKSRYFKEVIITPDITHTEDALVPIDVALQFPKAKQYNLGVGYGTFTGPRLTLGTEYRRIGENGQHFTAQIKISSVLSGLAAKYFIPGKNPLTDQYTLGADAQKFIPKNGQSFSENFSGSYIKTLPNWQHALNINYLIERYQVDNDPSELSRMLYPSYTLTHIQADNLITPHIGSSVNLTLQGASQHVLSAVNFMQTELKGKYITSPTENSRLILRGDIGYTAVDNLSRLPLTLRFFAGGLGSVRGYAYGSIGPGRYLETASIEYQHRIYDHFNGAIFFDAGTANDHFNVGIQRGAGLGIIYNSIVGAVQIYVARALSKPGLPYSIEFSIGPDL